MLHSEIFIRANTKNSKMQIVIRILSSNARRFQLAYQIEIILRIDDYLHSGSAMACGLTPFFTLT